MAKRTKSTALAVVAGKEPTGCVLSDKMATVLEALSAGRSMTETAEISRVARRTIYVWIKHNPAFRAAYNQWKNDVEESVRRRLTALTEVALDTLADTIAGGDAKLALEFLKHKKAIMPALADRPVTVMETRDEIRLENASRRMREEIEGLKLGAERGSAAISYQEWTRPLDEHTTVKRSVEPGGGPARG